MPHPRAPRGFVGGTENRSIEAASYPRIWDRVKRTAEVANVMDASVGAPTEHYLKLLAVRPERHSKDIAPRRANTDPHRDARARARASLIDPVADLDHERVSGLGAECAADVAPRSEDTRPRIVGLR